MKPVTETRLEWGMLAVVAIACASLSYLQYRWTGDLSAAERNRLHGGLERQVRQIVQSAEGDLRTACLALTPTAAEIRSSGLEQAHLARYRRNAGEFSRIWVSVPERGEARLYRIDPKLGLVGANGTDNATDAIRIPVFDGDGRERRRGELEWMIFEPDRDFLRRQLLPKYAGEYLNPGPEPEFDMSVSRAGDDRDVLFSTRPDGASVRQGADMTAGIFRSSGERASFERPVRWVLAVRHRAGSLDAAVNRARVRNLVTSFLLTGFLAVTAALLVRSTARSRRLSEMQLRFTAGVSHDLRTPLTAVRGAAFNLVHGMVTEPSAVERYARLILRNAEELSAMVENVLAYSSSPSSTQRAGGNRLRERVSVAELLDRTAAAMRPEIEEAHCQLELDIDPGIPNVEGDSLALEQAFRNLVANAVRHAAEGRWIGLSAKAQQNGVLILVRDRGPGIPRGEQRRIFEPFFRSDRTRTAGIRGAGLGLSLAQETARSHGGTLTVRSEPGQGAEFSFWLPAAPEPA